MGIKVYEFAEALRCLNVLRRTRAATLYLDESKPDLVWLTENDSHVFALLGSARLCWPKVELRHSRVTGSLHKEITASSAYIRIVNGVRRLRQ